MTNNTTPSWQEYARRAWEDMRTIETIESEAKRTLNALEYEMYSDRLMNGYFEA